MPHIHVLDQITIDKIAAGEVIERPASIVKELVENAIDAGSTSVKIEIKDGGISFIRITDNGCGIPQDEVQRAFLRHSTSKIETVEDLSHIASVILQCSCQKKILKDTNDRSRTCAGSLDAPCPVSSGSCFSVFE